MRPALAVTCLGNRSGCRRAAQLGCELIRSIAWWVRAQPSKPARRPRSRLPVAVTAGVIPSDREGSRCDPGAPAEPPQWTPGLGHPERQRGILHGSPTYSAELRPKPGISTRSLA